jgi:hypothetical protein
LMTLAEANAAVVAICAEMERCGLPRDFVSAMPPALVTAYAMLSDDARARVRAAIADAPKGGNHETR